MKLFFGDWVLLILDCEERPYTEARADGSSFVSHLKYAECTVLGVRKWL